MDDEMNKLLQIIQSQNERLDKLEKQNKKLQNELKVMKFRVQVSLHTDPDQGSWCRQHLIEHYLATKNCKLYLDLLAKYLSSSYLISYRLSSVVFNLKNEHLTEYYMFLIISKFAIPFDIYEDEFFGHVCIYWYNHGIQGANLEQEGFAQEFELFRYTYFTRAARAVRQALNNLLIPYWDVNLCNLIIPYLNLPHHDTNPQNNLGDWKYWTRLVKRRDGTDES